MTNGIRTALVVDDEDQIRRLLGRVLERAGYEIVEAGTQTMAAARAHFEAPNPTNFELALLDVHHARRAARRGHPSRSSSKRCPDLHVIILMSGDALPPQLEAERCWRSGKPTIPAQSPSSRRALLRLVLRRGHSGRGTRLFPERVASFRDRPNMASVLVDRRRTLRAWCAACACSGPGTKSSCSKPNPRSEVGSVRSRPSPVGSSAGIGEVGWGDANLRALVAGLGSRGDRSRGHALRRSHALVLGGRLHRPTAASTCPKIIWPGLAPRMDRPIDAVFRRPPRWSDRRDC